MASDTNDTNDTNDMKDMTIANTTDLITVDTPFSLEDDTYHTPTTDDPTWFETTWFSFSVPERRIGGWLHAGRSTNRNATTWRVFVWDPNGYDLGRLAYFRMLSDIPIEPDVDLRNITFPQGGFSVKMLKPLMNYHVAYADPDARFSIEFEHHSVHAPFRFTPGEAPCAHNPHLDQLGHVTGELVLDGERIAIDCYSIRDRTWGPRSRHHSHGEQPKAEQPSRVLNPGGARWREIERERGRGRIQYIFGHAGAETGFLSFVRVQDGDAAGWSPLNMGWLLRNGEFVRLDKTRSRMRNYRDPATGFTAHMEVELVDLSGRTMQAEGHAVSHMSENSSGSNASIRWEFDGKVGWGEDQDGWRVDHFARMRRALRTSPE
jgi:hypothetical protein